MKRATTIAILILLAAFALAAQTTTTLYGTVSDKSGAIVPGAQVVATNTATNFTRSGQTNEEGQYRLEFLPVGDYTVEVTAQGFKKFLQKSLVLEATVGVRADAVLEIGGVSETVTVSEAAPLVNTSNATIGRTVNNSEITNLPIVGRNVYTLLTLTPGVTFSQQSQTLGFPEQRTMVNGSVDGAVGSVDYLLDGGTNRTGLRNTGNVAPNPDAVQEFRVTTNNYSAEYGRFAGGVVSVLTKSGTNQFHGSVFEFLRNTSLNAHNWGALAAVPLHRNQYGATFGGPIRKDKTFFFASWSGLRQRQTTFLNSAIVPTALERQGDFSASSVKPKDPVTRQAYTNNKIPTGSFDPTALNILNKYIPPANATGNVFQGQVPNPFDSDEYLGKVDHALSSRQFITASYFTTAGTTVVQPGGNLPWSVQQFKWRQHNANLSDTMTLTPNLVNQFWLTYTRNFGGRLNLPGISLHDLGSTFNPQGTPSLPQITVSGYFTLGQAIAGPVAGTNLYAVRDMVSYTRGRHTLKFGGEMALDKDIQQTLLNNYGTFSFTASSTARSGNALADFLLGLPVTMNQDAPVTAFANYWTAGLFVQDDFRIHPRLTINLGLRWELQTAPTDPFDREATFIPGVQSTILPTAPKGLLVVGDPGVPRGTVATPKAHFSPRVGFAWDPFGDGKTSIRAGAGLFWASVSGNEWNASSNFQPFAVRQQFNNITSLSNVYGAFAGGVSPFPYSYDPKNPKFIAPSQLLGIAPNFRWPYTTQLNFSVQRQIFKDFSLTGSYVGSLTRHLVFGVDLNYPLTAANATTGNVNNRRPILPGVLAAVTSKQSIMTSNYHALQVTAEKRMGKHFALKSFYTWGKGVSGGVMEGSTDNPGVQDFRNMRLEHARLDNDRQHVFVASFVWQLNYFQQPVLHALVDGWQFSPIVTLQSGLPLTITAGQDMNLDGLNNDRANINGNAFLDPNRSRADVTAAWFNKAVFSVLQGTTGTAGRNILDGPGSKNMDLGIFRNFKIRERMSLQARGEFTNFFNFVNLNNPTTAFSSADFGKIRNAAAMRQIQVGLRLTF